MDPILTAVIGLLVGACVTVITDRTLGASARQARQHAADELLTVARKEAENVTRAAELAAKEKMIGWREEFETSTGERRRELATQEREIKEREQNLERKMDLLQTRLDELTRRDENLAAVEKEYRQKLELVDTLVKEQSSKLESVAALSTDEARQQLLAKTAHELTNERGLMIRQSLEDVRSTAQREAQKILVQTMQRFAGECAYERTTCTVPLPSDEMKGRIIGREGRNIRVFEAITGVNVLIDDTPSAVVIACFEPVRREVARLSLERLVADGRIHPTRVEEVVAKAREDIDDEVVKAGEEALLELQITGVDPQVVKILGRLRFRYSYTQNVLKHSIEVARFMAIMASELGLNVMKAKRMGLFHDIGKAMDHDIEGSHAIIGMEFLKRFGEDPEVLNGVGCHHDEIPSESPLASLVQVADALSASRPGARSETTDLYIRRLEQLEQIGASFEGVETCFAVQAGREIRVVVEPDSVNENQAYDLSRSIAQRIEAEMQYPGQIKVCVIRETRSVQYAK